MRSEILCAVVAAAALALTGCATAADKELCYPAASWSTPAFTCSEPVIAEAEPEPEPEPEREREPEPEPEPEPERVVVTREKIEITEKVQFEVNKAILLDESKGLLDEVARVMNEHPEIQVIQVEGHTDSTGGTRHNRKLSDKRAKAVRDYLVSRGVERARLVPKGFGEDVPMADNDTEEGRYQNRRVEFKILKRVDDTE
jgi:OmpA-OmpF porin, OOP family